MGRSLILASQSPRRRSLLRTLRVPFRVVPARVDETSEYRMPRKVVSELALRKARAVAERHPKSMILGADTIVVHGRKFLMKPTSRADSWRILRTLNGRWHRVYTGVALIDGPTGRVWQEVAVSRVKARRLPLKDLKRFVGKHMDKAGAYAVQDQEDPFVERIIGPFDNVVGLPMAVVRRLLKRASRRISA